ncbi:uncharacterized protein LY79DRAFT_332411 [Colletotrichum navitas]|uniref:Uncharacterized protein n=1 Tax=Colletotrichum navitas TaxID=681940 RepID=A0AAD8PSJ8_9PEZI|nr:uncharacterized protein LY79DRAFT_332411 [Colletotrichum navitas]KAK1579880.1 hypothetical protein LY79DRAFT_332411 [Colletotrichum navitas]
MSNGVVRTPQIQKRATCFRTIHSLTHSLTGPGEDRPTGTEGLHPVVRIRDRCDDVTLEATIGSFAYGGGGGGGRSQDTYETSPVPLPTPTQQNIVAGPACPVLEGGRHTQVVPMPSGGRGRWSLDRPSYDDEEDEGGGLGKPNNTSSIAGRLAWDPNPTLRFAIHCSGDPGQAAKPKGFREKPDRGDVDPHALHARTARTVLGPTSSPWVGSACMPDAVSVASAAVL